MSKLLLTRPCETLTGQKGETPMKKRLCTLLLALFMLLSIVPGQCFAEEEGAAAAPAALAPAPEEEPAEEVSRRPHRPECGAPRR